MSIHGIAIAIHVLFASLAAAGRPRDAIAAA